MAGYNETFDRFQRFSHHNAFMILKKFGTFGTFFIFYIVLKNSAIFRRFFKNLKVF